VWNRTVCVLVGSTFLVATVACSTSERTRENSASIRQQLTLPGVLGFEQVASDWSLAPGSGSAVLTSTNAHTEGASAARVSNLGWAKLQSVRIGPLGATGTSARFDIRVEGTGTIPWGDVSMQLDAPSAGLLDQWVDQRALGGTQRGTFQAVQFPLSAALVTKLSAGSLTDLSVRLTLNLPASSSVTVDRLSFGQASGGSGGGGSGGGGSGGTPAGGAGGNGGQGGSIGGSGTEQFFIELASNLRPVNVALGTYGDGSLVIEDGVKVVSSGGAFATVSSVRTTIPTQLGVGTEVMNLFSTPNVWLRGSHVHGNIRTGGSLVPSPDGSTSPHRPVNGGMQPGHRGTVPRRRSWPPR